MGGSDTIAIIGVGLIGGSLARALKAKGVCRRVTGYCDDARQTRRALELGVVDHAAGSVADAVGGAQMIVIAVPIGATRGVLEAIVPVLEPHTVITDVGSVKCAVVEAAREVLGAAIDRFVPGHPVAGTEKSGVEASFAELFEAHRVILTPTPEVQAAAVERTAAMWRAVGATVEYLDVEKHDAVLAATSHLPHLLAYSLVHLLACSEEHDDVFRYAAGGFRDFTRIASSDPRMWHDIVMANRAPIIEMIARFSDDLSDLARAIQDADSDMIMQRFDAAKAARDEFTAGLS